MRFKVQVKVTANTMSPAVCGLFRPAILMPRALTEQFSNEQFRAVLLHELIHLRRRDVWVNFLQSLLQISYWWHPLVWVASARIRRIREEAVDDAVMLALRDDAEAYAPTLLEVAKLALNRPLASLGLVGILESRRALRQRIERLVDFRAPRRAGLTLASVLGVIAFTVVAVPMGQGPVTADGTTPAALKIPAAAGTETNDESILVVARFFQSPAGDLDHVVLGLKPDGTRKSGNPCWQVAPEEFGPFVQRVQEAGFKQTLRPQILTKSGKPAEMFIGNETNNINLTCSVHLSEGLISLLMRVEAIGTYAGVSKTNLVNFNTGLKPEAGIMAYFGKSEDGTTSNTIVLIQARVITNTAAWLADGRAAAAISKRQAEAEKTSAEPDVEQNQAGTAEGKATAGIYVQDAKLAYEMGKLEKAEEGFKSALRLDPGNAAAKYYLGQVKQARQAVQSSNGIQTGPGREEILAHLGRIRFTKMDNDNDLTLKQVLDKLNELVRFYEKFHPGGTFTFVTSADAASVPGIDPATGQPVRPPDAGAVIIYLPPALKDVSLLVMLDEVIKNASQPIQYSILDDQVVFSIRSPEDAMRLYTRTYQTSPRAFISKLQMDPDFRTATNSPVEISAAARKFFNKLGADFGVESNSPAGKALFFNQQTGILFVKATLADLEIVEKAIVTVSAPQIHIKARFMEVSREGFDSSGTFTNKSFPGMIGILTSEQEKNILQMLKARHAVTLAEPEIVTSSERRARIMATQIFTIITNMCFQESGTNRSIFPQLEKIEVGPVLDEVCSVLADDYTINLNTTVTMTNFLGYEKDAAPRTVYDQAGEKIDVPGILPSVQVRQGHAHLNLYDGQTAVLSKFESYPVEGLSAPDFLKTAVKSKSDEKELLVFITATLVDAAGNRIHSDDDLPFDKNTVPPQTGD